MTDKDRFIAFLNTLDIGFKERSDGSLRLSEGDSMIDGYSDFYTEITFSSLGVFDGIGAYEGDCADDVEVGPAYNPFEVKA